jgi:hypothetical protein
MVMPNIDDAAHVGGLAEGIFFGIVMSQPLTPAARARRPVRNLRAVGLGTALIVAGMISVYAWNPNLVAVDDALEQFDSVDIKTHDILVDAAARAERKELSDWAFADLLERDVIPDWRTARNRLSAIKPIPAAYRDHVADVLEYMRLRQDSWELFAEGLRDGDVQKGQRAEEKHKLADEAAQRWADRADR